MSDDTAFLSPLLEPGSAAIGARVVQGPPGAGEYIQIHIADSAGEKTCFMDLDTALEFQSRLAGLLVRIRRDAKGMEAGAAEGDGLR